MESKTKKATKKTTVKKEVIKNEEVIVKNQIDYTNVLNKIFYALMAIAIILGVNLIVNIVTNADTVSNEVVEEENVNYDVSEFEVLSTTDAAKKIEEGGTHVVYIGRENCGYCVQFIPVLQQAQKEVPTWIAG